MITKKRFHHLLKGVSFELLKGMTCGEAKKLTEDYNKQLRRLRK